MRALPSLLLSVLALSTLSGCVFSTDAPASRDRAVRDRAARERFEDLLSRGRTQSVTVAEFSEGGSFDEVEGAFADEPDPGKRIADGVVEGEADAELDLLSGLVSEAEAQEEDAEPPLNPYLEFGQNIVWYELRDGDTERLIMKPFSFPVGTGQKIFSLLQTYGDFTVHAAVLDGAIPEGLGPQPQGSVLLDLREGFAIEAYADPRPPALRAPQTVPLSDVLFVTATANDLWNVQHFIDLFAAEVEQIEIEAKIVEVSSREALDLGIRNVDRGVPTFGLPNPGTFVNGVDFAFANSSAANEALFQLGAVFDGVTFNAILEAVATFEDVQIISRPKVAVRAGGRADIVNVTRIPFYKVNAITASGVPTLSLDYQDVGVQMYVIPRVVGRDTVVLNIDIEASQETGSAVTVNVGGARVSTPQISKRNARTIVRLEPGQAVILGGLISERTVERESKVPIVGDIPVVGTLFRSKLTSKERTSVLFFIRPRILEGSDLNSPFE